MIFIVAPLLYPLSRANYWIDVKVHYGVPVGDSGGSGMVGGECKGVIGHYFSEGGVDCDTAEDVIVVKFFADSQFAEPID